MKHGGRSIRRKFVLILIMFAVLCAQAFGQTAAKEWTNKSLASQQIRDSNRIISGYVYDYDTKDPISNASLELTGQVSIMPITDTNGYYEFSINCGNSQCSMKSYEISCIAEGYNPTKIAITINKNGKTNSTDIYLKSINKCPGSLSDGFDQENADLWLKSNWMNNDPIYLSTWKSDFNHIRIEDGNLSLNLDNQPCVNNKSQCQNQDFASGEYYTTCDQYRYGELEAKILVGKGNGVVTSMFFLGGVPGEQDEIDVEIFGKDAVKPGRWEMQTNYFKNGDKGNCQAPYGVPEPCHVAIIPLNFDPTQSYHIYKISWIGKAEKCNEIKWYVDDKLRRHVWLDKNGYVQSNVLDESGNIIEDGNSYNGNLPVARSKIFLSLWAARNWSEAGYFNYSPEKLIHAKIDWLRYTRLSQN